MIRYQSPVTMARPRINDGMTKFIAKRTVMHMIAAGSHIKGSRVNVMGLPFNESYGDPRSSDVPDVTHEQQSYSVGVHVTGQQADVPATMHAFGINLARWDYLPRTDAILAAAAHSEYQALSVDDLNRMVVKGGVFIDVKVPLAGASGGQAQDLAGMNRSLLSFKDRPCGY